MIVDKNLVVGGVGGSLAIVVLGTGIVYLQESGMPGCTLLFSDDGYDNDYLNSTGVSKDKTKIGGELGWYLIGVYGKGDEGNREWWEWSYERWKKDLERNNVNSEEFKNTGKNVKLAYVKKNEEGGFNKLCEVIYKKDISEIKEDNKETTKHALKVDLLRYCSPLQTIPTNIKENKENYSVGSYGANKSELLVSVKDSKNDLFWKLRGKEFLDETRSEGGWAESQKFQDLLSNKGDLKNLCGETYNEQEISGDPNKLGADLKRYCYLRI